MKSIKKGILKGLGFLFLFFVITSIIYNFSSPSRYALSNVSYEGFDKIELDEGIYLGEVANKLFTGKGEFRFLNGVIYTGDWQESQMNGDGTCSYPGIGTYTGKYTGAVRSGTGTFTWENGDSYTGEWEEDTMTDGTYTFSDGSTYKGSFQEGKVADGTFSCVISKEETEVQELTLRFKAGQASDLLYKLSNGFFYEGSLEDGGNASIIYENGDTYSGQVSKGLREGKGIYTWMQDGSEIAKFEGMWSGNMMSGEGICYYTGDEYPTLSGTFENGIPSGKCIYTKEADNTFTANFENGSCTSVE